MFWGEIAIQAKAAFSRECHIDLSHCLHNVPALRLASKELLLWSKRVFSRSMNGLPLYLKISKNIRFSEPRHI